MSLKLIVSLCVLGFASCFYSNFDQPEKYNKTSNEVKCLNDINEDINEDENVKTMNLIDSHINYFMENKGKREIIRIKKVLGFDDNVYLLFELAPEGYILYHPETCKIIEYAENSKSPFLDYESELFYGGMLNYFHYENNIYINTITKEKVVLNSDISSLVDNSTILYNNLKNDIDYNNLDYIENKSNLQKVISSWKKEEAVTYSRDVEPKIAMKDFFEPLKNSNDFGYADHGACGYIAANLVLAYNDFAYDDSLVADEYLVKSSRKINGNLLSRKLIEIAGENPDESIPGTIPDFMGDVLRTYLKTRAELKEKWKVTTWWGIINADGAISKNQPVILYGNLKKPKANTYSNGDSTNHAVVAYGKENGKYIVHYGWSNRSRVVLDYNAIGGNVILSFF